MHAQEPDLSSTADQELAVLAAACDMAVLRALELVGKRVARNGRSRYGAMMKSGRDWHEAHTIWLAEPKMVDDALAGAWAVVPRLTKEHGCCALVEPEVYQLLDAYVRELVFAQKPHTFEALEVRLAERARAVS